ncbi:hypothetical protein KBY58_01620 [Cyanobium sp. HWJ4-Hawea]|uniref:hypothetical protein n=1 Tax=unclassified Cyanobium TaxID=2627006 RepID=UPI0020CEAB8D|nr:MULTISPECIES: hypothetical protein [unclassified Cyanobium]MCP9775539.1 hypothetical protein [Cyanobium sp. WAJ14-Wanaka]MCP9808131.1 hypothetical protein [Cyanobium sp. HWJ4-Hawea]
MAYFTWKETGLTGDCASLEAMAARFEEAAKLMRRMAQEGFSIERHSDGQHITHPDPAVFEAYGFVSEESPVRQLTLLCEP